MDSTDPSAAPTALYTNTAPLMARPPSSTPSRPLAVYLSTNPIQHQRTKHVKIDLHFIREKVPIDQVCVLHVPTASQFTDIFTKGLPSSVFNEFRSSLNICSG
jgi:hypothetical protein